MGAASTLFSIVVTTSAKQLLAQVLEYYLLYYIILKTVSSARTISRIAFAMVAAMTVCCVFGLLEIYAQWSVLSIFPAELQLTYGNIYAELLIEEFGHDPPSPTRFTSAGPSRWLFRWRLSRHDLRPELV